MTGIGNYLTACVLIIAQGLLAMPASASGAYSPSVPVTMKYELPDTLPDSGELRIEVQLATPMPQGELRVEVISAEGLTVLEGGRGHYSVAPGAQSFTHGFRVLLDSAVSRLMMVEVTIETTLGPMERIYRLDMSPPAAIAPETTDPALKFLPATRPR